MPPTPAGSLLASLHFQQLQHRIQRPSEVVRCKLNRLLIAQVVRNPQTIDMPLADSFQIERVVAGQGCFELHGGFPMAALVRCLDYGNASSRQKPKALAMVCDPTPLITRYESLRAKLDALDDRGESFSEEAQEIDRELVEIERQLDLP